MERIRARSSYCGLCASGCCVFSGGLGDKDGVLTAIRYLMIKMGTELVGWKGIGPYFGGRQLLSLVS